MAMDDATLLNLINGRVDRAEQNQQDSFDDAKEYLKLYLGEKSQKEYEWQSNLSAMEIYATVESALPKIMRSILPPGKIIRTRMRPPLLPNPKVAPKRSKIVQNLVNYDFDEIPHFFHKTEIWFRQALMYPYSIVKVARDYYYNQDTGKLDKDGILFDPVNYYDFLYQPGATSIDTAGWVAHRFIRTREYIEGMFKRGTYKNRKEALKTSWGRNYFRDEILELERGSTETEDEEFEILEYYAGGEIVTVINRQVIVWRRPNRYGWKPFTRIQYTPLPFSMKGMSMISPLEVMANELDDLKNVRYDRWQQMVLPVNIVGKYAGVDPADLDRLNEPGFTLVATDVNQVKEFRKSDTPISSYKEEDILIGNLQRAHGMVNLTARTNSPAVNDTATGISIAQEEVSSRLTLVIQRFGLEGIVDVAEKIYDIEKLRLKRARQISVSLGGKESFPYIGPKDLDVNVKFEPMWSLEASSRRSRQIELVNLYGRIAAEQNYRRPKLEAKLMQKIMEEYDVKGIEESDYEIAGQEPPEGAGGPGGAPGAAPGGLASLVAGAGLQPGGVPGGPPTINENNLAKRK